MATGGLSSLNHPCNVNFSYFFRVQLGRRTLYSLEENEVHLSCCDFVKPLTGDLYYCYCYYYLLLLLLKQSNNKNMTPETNQFKYKDSKIRVSTYTHTQTNKQANKQIKQVAESDQLFRKWHPKYSRHTTPSNTPSSS